MKQQPPRLLLVRTLLGVCVGILDGRKVGI